MAPAICHETLPGLSMTAQLADVASHGRDLWLEGIQRELADCQVEPACAALVSSMLTFQDADRPSAAELVQSAWLQSQP